MSAGAWFERTPLRERLFLALEMPAVPLHFGAVLVFEAGPARPDLERMRARLAARLPAASRLRQRLARVPLLGDPVWVDDGGFDLAHHVSHVRLQSPHEETRLRALAAGLFSGALPRARPLWRLWLVDGLASGGFALVLKIHHAIANGTSAAGLLRTLLDGTPDAPPGQCPPWTPRPAPGPAALLGQALVHRASLPLALAGAIPALLGQARAGVARLREAAGALTAAAPAVALRGATGPTRRLDWLALDLREVRAAADTLGGTVNDVVLTAVTGALAQFLSSRGGGERGAVVRALVPVLLRGVGGAERASLWTVPLPVGEPDVRRRFVRVRAETAERKRSRPEGRVDALLAFADRAGVPLVDVGVRLAAAWARFDLLVTNVPGPEEPLSFAGARCVAAYPVPPVLPGQTVALAVASYAGGLFVGLAADRALVPDLADLTAAVREAFGELVHLSRDGARGPVHSGGT